MRNTVTVTQTFPTWAAAYEARGRLAEEDGFDRFGIDDIEIGRLGPEFELLIRTDEFHRDQIEHLLRSSGTNLNPPATMEGRRWPSVAPVVLLGAAALTGVGLYALLSRTRDRHGNGGPASLTGGASADTWSGASAASRAPMFTLEVNGTPLAVTKGNESEARAIFDSVDFKAKLRAMERDGKALWNGVDRFRIRPASASEIRALVQYAETLGFEDEEEGEVILYLQPIDTGDEFDETQDG
jgi:hypothetical protein